MGRSLVMVVGAISEWLRGGSGGGWGSWGIIPQKMGEESAWEEKLSPPDSFILTSQWDIPFLSGYSLVLPQVLGFEGPLNLFSVHA